MKEKNKGITIIALVITIIIMLILATVTIRIAFKGGLIDYAKKATGDMQNAIDKEKEIMDGRIEEDGVWYNSIEDYIAGIPSGSQGGEEPPDLSHNWTRGTGDDIDKFTCLNCKKTYTMGQKINYKPNGSVTSTTITAEKSGLDKYYEKNNSYPEGAVVDANGNQTITRQYTDWIVLGIEDTDKDGVKETLLITTESPVPISKTGSTSNNLHLYGAAAYNYMASYYDASGNKVEGELDRVCKLLYSSTYGEARGMTIEDVNEALNYKPLGGYYSENSVWKTTGNLKTKLKDLSTWNKIKGTNKSPDSPTVENENKLGEYELNGYWYEVNTDEKTLINPVNTSTVLLEELEKNIIFGQSKNYIYCLSSRGAIGNNEWTDFGPGAVHFGGACSCYGLFNSHDGAIEQSFGLRPVVSLLFDIPEFE